MPKPSNYIEDVLNCEGGRGNKKLKWKLSCTECGKEYLIYPDHKRKTTICKKCMLINKNTTHNMSRNRIYSVWTDMKKRCNNEKHKMYKYYGGSGISVDFNSFEDFYDWSIKNGYNDELEIDRIDTHKNYSADNCRFITRQEQMMNTRVIYSHNKSGYRGVHNVKGTNKWVAQISVMNKKIYIGRYDSAKEAGLAYDNYIRENNLKHSTNFN